MIEGDYCGCCGREVFDSASLFAWCAQCLSHLAQPASNPPWERTYYAQHGKDCPFQEELKGESAEWPESPD